MDEKLKPEEWNRYLEPTAILDFNHPRVRDYAKAVAGSAQDPVDKAVSLYRAVRDEIWYDPYSPFYLPDHYRASFVLQRGRSFCIPKAALLCALARACEIPSRLGFANVKNHLATRQLLEYIGSDLFVYHGFVELYLNGKWVKATPAFNKELCERHHVPPLEFDGLQDSLFQPFNAANQKYMQYMTYLGVYVDVPVDEILASWRQTYGQERVANWIANLEESKGESPSRFEEETVV